jgi:hypothetical protein
MNGFTLELQSIGYKSQKFGAFFFLAFAAGNNWILMST